MKEKIILIGGGGHCRSIIDLIEEEGFYEIAGIVDLHENVGALVLGYTIIGTDEDLQNLRKSYKNACICIGHLKSNERRRTLYSNLKHLDFILPIIKSPNCYISKSASIGEGTVVMHHAVINANSKVGIGCIVNTAGIIEHDVQIGDFCHIGPAASLNGGCIVQSDCLVGSNSVTLPGTKISQGTIVAAGSVVISDTQKNSLVAGNPAIRKKNLA